MQLHISFFSKQCSSESIDTNCIRLDGKYFYVLDKKSVFCIAMKILNFLEMEIDWCGKHFCVDSCHFLPCLQSQYLNLCKYEICMLLYLCCVYICVATEVALVESPPLSMALDCCTVFALGQKHGLQLEGTDCCMIGWPRYELGDSSSALNLQCIMTFVTTGKSPVATIPLGISIVFKGHWQSHCTALMASRL